MMEATLESLQDRHLEIFGTYDVEKTLLWMVEELGEISSAFRKGESKERIKEEISDLLNLVFILSNTLDLKVEELLDLGVAKETQRLKNIEAP